ncbi:MAG: retropepsin-like aspartic protease [Bacteroidota bacterium]
MSSLKKFLQNKGYTYSNLKVISTQHLQLEVKINGVLGSFILDTGASSSCVDFTFADHFKLLTEESDVRAAGAGGNNMLTRISVDNKVEIEQWSAAKMNLVLIDLGHVNAALEEHQAEVVHGILGADLLEKSKAVIDYKKKRLYLK